RVDLRVGTIVLRRIRCQGTEDTQESKWAAVRRLGTSVPVDSGGCGRGAAEVDLPGVPVVDIVVVAEDSEPRAIRQYGGENLGARGHDLLIPQCVKEGLVFLDRAAIGEVVLVLVSPVRRNAWRQRVVEPRVSIQRRVLYIPHGRAPERIRPRACLDLELPIAA